MPRKNKQSRKSRTTSRANFAAALPVTSISAFWKNDVPGGIGLTFRFGDRENGNRMLAGLEATLADYDRNATPEAIVAQLEAWGGTSLSMEQKYVAVANVYWLERRGHLKSDDFNGVLVVRDSSAGCWGFVGGAS